MLQKEIVIRPAQVGVLDSLRRSKVTVIRRPVVAILATGGVSAGDYDVAKRDITYPLPRKNY